MDKTGLHPDFKDFLRLLSSHDVRYLLVGGYAVGYYGFPRATGDMDIWIELSETNSRRIASAFREFAIPSDAISEELFLQKNKVIRMGVPPVRLEVITSASGLDFEECYNNRSIIEIDGIPVNLISLEDLKKNKLAAGRYRDLEDLRHLP